MALKLKNDATSVLAGSITDTATALSVSAGEGARFPTLGAGDWFPLNLINSSGAKEIVKVTARATDAMTIVRAQEGTTALAFTAGDRVDLRLTVAAIATFMQGVNDLSDLADAAAARGNLGLGSAALTNSSDYATAAQGAKADTAVQPAAIGTIAAKNIATAANIIAKSGTDALTTDKVWDASAWIDLGNVTGSITIDANTGSRFYGTVTGNLTVDITNQKNGQPITLAFYQDATGGRTVSFNSRFKFTSTPTVGATANGNAVCVAAEGTWSTSIVLASAWKY